MKQLIGYMHGINLGGWLSQCNYKKDHCDSFIVEEDIKKIKDWGLDHVRLPVDYNVFLDEEMNFIEYGFDYVQSCIDWCKKYGLNMILDLHKTVGYSFAADEHESGLFDENSKYEAVFLKLWQEFTDRYAKYEDMLCFELLNEVTDQSYSPKWNALAKKAIIQIRKTAPTIKILVGSYWNNHVAAVKDMDPPYDENVVYNFHCYEPLIFTHQGATWLGPNMHADFRMKFDSTYGEYSKLTCSKMNQMQSSFDSLPQNEVPDEKYFEQLFAEALKVAEERNVTLYCGEYGVIDLADPEEILKWFAVVSKVFDAHGIGRAVWTYKGMNFGVSNTYTEACSKKVIELL